MAINFVSSAVSLGGSVILPPGRQINDLELVFQTRNGSNSPPNLGAFWPITAGGGSNNAIRLSARFCADPDDTSAAIGSSSHIHVAAYRGALGWRPAATSYASSNTMNYPALTLGAPNDDSWVFAAGTHRTASDVGVAPAGLTLRRSAGSGPQSAIFDTDGPVATWAGATQTVDSISGRAGLTIELLPYSCFNPAARQSNTTVGSTGLTASGPTTLQDPSGLYDAVIGTFPHTPQDPVNPRRAFRVRFTSAGTNFAALGIAQSSAGSTGSSNSASTVFTISNSNDGATVQDGAGGTHAAWMGQNDWIYVFVDCAAQKVSFYWDGAHLGGADPDAGTDCFSLSGLLSPELGFFPFVGFAAGLQAAEYDGDPDLSGIPSVSSFLAWDADGAPEVDAPGATLTATASLTAGGATGQRNATAAGETMVRQASLVAGDVVGQRNVTVAGDTVSGAASLLAGSGAGSADVQGFDLTGTASLIVGSVSVSVVVAGKMLTAPASLVAGAATGQRHVTAAGQTLAVAASVVDGAATGQRHVTAGGVVLSASASIIAGDVSAARNASVNGQTLDASTALIPGEAAFVKSATVPGATLTVTASLTAGAPSAVANVTAIGATLAAAAAITSGVASGQRSLTVPGVIMGASAFLTPGAAVGQRSPTTAGVILSSAASLLSGAASGGASATASGVQLSVSAGLLGGAASGGGRAVGAVLAAAIEFAAGVATATRLRATPMGRRIVQDARDRRIARSAGPRRLVKDPAT